MQQKEYKTRHDGVGKVIHLVLYKKLKFNHTNQLYMQNSESVQENETHNFLWNFEILTDHLISARLPVITNKKKRTCQIVDFAISTEHGVKLTESEKKEKYTDLARELKKTVHYKSDSDTNSNWCSWYSHQRIDTDIGWQGNKRTRGEHPNYNIIKIDQNTEESPGDLRILSITKDPVKNIGLRWCGKLEKEKIIIMSG